ncbi:MAG: hypothetical protein ACOC0D_02830, partial [Spirochaeta sp.]
RNKLGTWIAVGSIMLNLASCATMDRSQRYLTLDLQGESVPVMLNTPEEDAGTRMLTLESGYQTSTRTAASGDASVSITTGNPINQPLGVQLRALLSDSLLAVYVHNLELDYMYSSKMYTSKDDIRRLNMTVRILHP